MLIKAKLSNLRQLGLGYCFSQVEINAESQKKIEIIAQHLQRLNAIELQYFNKLINEKKGYKIEDEITQEWIDQQQKIESLWPKGLQGVSYVLNQNLSGIGGGAANQQINVQEQGQSEEKKETETLEKTSFDLELKEYEASGKLKIIKELRGLLNLGLKEAKELVEKAPVTIQKNVAKKDAEVLQQKLEQLGCKIQLL